jgi:sensor histidine kinase YesM
MAGSSGDLRKYSKSITAIVFFTLVSAAGIFFYTLISTLLDQQSKIHFHNITIIILSFISILCVTFILLKIIIPLNKSIKLLDEINDLSLLEKKKITMGAFSSLQNLGLIGLLIEKMAKVISMEPKAKLLGAEVALYALQSQINPHFLYNTLDTIRNYAMNYGVPEVAEMTQSMASIFRYSISRPGEVASLDDEIKNIKAYLKIQWYRFSDRFNVVWDIDEENDDIMKYSLPILTLQPLVENAIQHGLANILKTGVITIRATTTQSKLIVSVEDNGCGISADKLNSIREQLNQEMYSTENMHKKLRGKKSGISLVNVNQRLKLYYGDKGGLSINSIEGLGTSLEIEVPKI